MKVIQNGLLVDIEESICTNDGWLPGVGIFETIKTENSHPWALSRHMRRAINAASVQGLIMPDEELIRKSIQELMHSEPLEHGVLRISIDSTNNWAAVHLPYIPKITAAKICLHPHAVVSNGVSIKSFPYSHRLEILNLAESKGFNEAIVTNAQGKICEGAVTNLLFKVAGVWCTPPLSDGALPGVMRSLVIENCDVTVRSIDVSEIPKIESGFLLSSLRLAQEIACIENQELSQSHQFQREIEAMARRTSVG